MKGASDLRQHGWLERPYPWLGILVFTSVGASLVALALYAGDLEDLDRFLFPSTVRGYTVLGLASGVFAVSLAAAALAYSLRKRSWQERLPLFRSTMMTWLWSHVTFGLLAFVLVLFHGGHGVFSLRFSTGKAALGILFLLVASGVVWRLVYAVVPPRAAPRIGNYAEEGSARRADEQLTEIEKLAAGRSPELQALKNALLAHAVHATEYAERAARFGLDEKAVLEEIHRLSMSRDRALLRQRLQHRYSSFLQAWRLAHIPLTILFIPAVVVHVVFALDLPAKTLPKDLTPPLLSGFDTADACASCHRTIYDQWKGSMHAHAMKSPLMIAQNNQLLALELAKTKAPDPRGICVNCHGPVGMTLADGEKLPLRGPFGGDALLNEGISCSVCHQHVGKPTPGQGGLAKFQESFQRGSTYYGPIRDPVGNAFHQSEFAGVFKNSDDLCVGCHNVSYDKNGDGKIVKGQDLVLQVTDEEYQEYRAGGGDQTCVTCHMPRLQKTRVAEGASIPFEQDREAPARALHDHSFAAVDYPLDVPASKDAQKPIRDALLKSATKIDLVHGSASLRGLTVSFDVTVTNAGAGHYVPTGFAFARQMWLEITVTDPQTTLFSSGVLADASADLCDAATVDEPNNPMRSNIVGCDRSDPQLVNFQRKLVSHFEIATDKDGLRVVNDRGDPKLVQAEFGQEEWLQRLTSGVVDRVRPSDKQPMSAIRPGDTRTFHYTAALSARPAGELSIKARLLFRSLPPYMVRALGEHQPQSEKPRLSPLVTRLEVVEMASIRQSLSQLTK